MSDHDEIGAFLGGFIVGGLTGAFVALLFAPQSGEDARRLIKDKSIELRDKARSSVAEMHGRAEGVASLARSQKEAAPCGPSGSGGGRPAAIQE